MSKSASYITRENKICAPNYAPLPAVLCKGKGVWLWDVDGKKYIDMMAAYSAVSHGHAHPRILKVLQEQSSVLSMTSRAYYTNTLAPFLEKVCQLSGLDQALPMNTGAEAVETAIKACRRWGYEKKGIVQDKAEIIVAKGNFHGRTTTIISFSSEPEYKKGFGPLTPGFVEVPFNEIDPLEKAINKNTCAILFEPIQGEAGIIVPKNGWLKQVYEIAKQNNVLFIADEVQSGLGRTGKMFAVNHEGFTPDGLILGKALGGGLFPVSLLAGTNELMNVFTPGSHGSTFGGNPLGAAIALEALNIIEDEDLCQKSADLGNYFMQQLKKIQSPLIKALRGRGLWIALEIAPQHASARQVCETLCSKGLLSKETHDTVVRLAPPLIITKQELDYAIDILKDVLEGWEV